MDLVNKDIKASTSVSTLLEKVSVILRSPLATPLWLIGFSSPHLLFLTGQPIRVS